MLDDDIRDVKDSHIYKLIVDDPSSISVHKKSKQ